MLALTGRAGGRHGHSSSAPMAAKLAAIVRAAVGVIGHRNAAGRAGNSLTTASAGEEIVVSSAVDKEDGLISALLGIHQLLAEHIAKRRSNSACGALSHVNHRYARKLCAAVAVFERYERVFAFLCLVVAVKGRSCRCEQHK